QECHRTNAPTFQQEYRLLNKWGEYNWYADFVRVIKDESDKPEYYQGYIYDISKRKKVEEALRQSEERFRFVSSSIANISYSCKTDEFNNYQIDWIFGASEIITGYTAEELVDLKCWGHLVAEEDFPLFRKHILEVSPGKSDSCQLRINHKNGSILWVEATAECKVDENNPETLFLYGAIININERKLAEEALIHSEQELRKTNKMKDKFFSIISHDLRSPFQGLIGMANILVEDEDLTVEERKEFTVKLYESLKTQFHFIDDLLTWNRVQRGAIEFIPATDDLGSVIQETIELLKNGIENKQLQVIYEKPGSVILNFDRNMAATIVRNLLTNAIKFTPQGGVIKIFMDNMPDVVTVSVQDSGVGIEKFELNKLWDSEIHRSTKGTQGEDGTGLGLILCKEFVEKHNGTISADSEINVGSTFRFSIPKNLPVPENEK
ncbi:MAG: ATP-binding protein, partial [Melioribacteraceae bacterium]